MKVSPATASPPSSSREAPVIGLDPPKSPNSKDENRNKYEGKSVKIALRTNPSDAGSETVDRYFPIFHTGTPEEWIIWLRNWEMIRKGLNLTTGAAWCGMVRQLLDGDALQVFDAEIENAPTMTMVRVTSALQVVAASEVFPKNDKFHVGN